MGCRTFDDLLNGSIVVVKLMAAGQQLHRVPPVSTSAFDLSDGFYFIHNRACGFKWDDPRKLRQFVPLSRSKALTNPPSTFS